MRVTRDRGESSWFSGHGRLKGALQGLQDEHEMHAEQDPEELGQHADPASPKCLTLCDLSWVVGANRTGWEQPRLCASHLNCCKRYAMHQERNI